MLLSGEEEKQQQQASEHAEEGDLFDIDADDSLDEDERNRTIRGAPASISAQEARRRGANPVSDFISSSNDKSQTQRDLHISDEGSDYESGFDEPLRIASRHQFSDDRPRHRAHRRFRDALPTPAVSHSGSRKSKLWEKMKKAGNVLNDIMTPPLWASVASIIVALTPGFQEFLNNHTKPFKGALKNAGECSIPITLVVLGAYFYTPPEEMERDAAVKEEQERSRQSSSQTLTAEGRHGAADSSSTSSINLVYNQPAPKSPAPAPLSLPSYGHSHRALLSASWDSPQAGETKTVIVALVSRMLIVPVLLLPLFWISSKTAFQDVFAE